jgi:hypothetical protein
MRAWRHACFTQGEPAVILCSERQLKQEDRQMSKWRRLSFAGLLSMGMVTQSLLVNAQEALEIEKKKAKEEVQEDPLAVTMAIQADSFFGFNPAVYGTYKLSENFAVAFQWYLVDRYFKPGCA